MTDLESLGRRAMEAPAHVKSQLVASLLKADPDSADLMQLLSNTFWDRNDSNRHGRALGKPAPQSAEEWSSDRATQVRTAVHMLENVRQDDGGQILTDAFRRCGATHLKRTREILDRHRDDLESLTRSSWIGLDGVEAGEILKALREAMEQAQAAQQRERQLVQAARAAACSWESIAATLGISISEAERRFEGS